MTKVLLAESILLWYDISLYDIILVSGARLKKIPKSGPKAQDVIFSLPR